MIWRVIAVLVLALSALPPAMASNKVKAVNWQTLRLFNYQTGSYPPQLGELLGTTVVIPGFAVPLDMEGKNVAAFLLVPEFGMCIHVPPPPPNQMIHVKMSKSVEAEKLWRGPVWVTGTLQIVKEESVYGVLSFTMDEASIMPYVLPGR